MPRGRGSNNGVRRADAAQDSAATLGFEAKLWQAADALRNNMDAAEYKHVVLGLIFLKYISDAFEAKHAELDAQRGEGADPEDPDEYRAENIFWVPPEARWSYLKGAAPQPTIRQIVDDAMAAIERDNPSLKSVLPKQHEHAARATVALTCDGSISLAPRRAAISIPSTVTSIFWSN
jgi:type I restriction enzyme M protein